MRWIDSHIVTSSSFTQAHNNLHVSPRFSKLYPSKIGEIFCNIRCWWSRRREYYSGTVVMVVLMVCLHWEGSTLLNFWHQISKKKKWILKISWGSLKKIRTSPTQNTLFSLYLSTDGVQLVLPYSWTWISFYIFS